MSISARSLARMSLGLGLGLFAMAGPVLAATQADYAEALECAAVQTAVSALLEREGSKPQAEQLQAGAERWLMRGITLNPAGEDATMADFDSEVDRTIDRMQAEAGADARDGDLQDSLRLCLMASVKHFGEAGQMDLGHMD